jgi:hypothetical protein
MEKTLFSKLPREINQKALLNLPYPEAKEKCAEFNVCDEKFWQKYVDYQYGIKEKFDQLKWSKVAKYAYDIVDELNSHGLYPTFRILPTLFEYVINDKEALNDFYEKFEANNEDSLGLYGLADIAEDGIFGSDDVEEIRILIRDGIGIDPSKAIKKELSKLTDLAKAKRVKKYLQDVMKAALKPTTYLTTKGSIELNVDVDVIFALGGDEVRISRGSFQLYDRPVDIINKVAEAEYLKNEL